jgi:plasmid stability protein
MGTSITIRDLPDDTIERLTSQAVAAGQSLEGYVRSYLIELAGSTGTLDVETWVAAVRRSNASGGTRVTADQILRHRDAGRP